MPEDITHTANKEEQAKKRKNLKQKGMSNSLLYCNFMADCKFEYSVANSIILVH